MKMSKTESKDFCNVCVGTNLSFFESLQPYDYPTTRKKT